jgi:iron-sulfur cluster assembly protein
MPITPLDPSKAERMYSMAIILTESAVKEIKKVKVAQSLDADNCIRLAIVGGGCSGMQYSLGFDKEYDPATDMIYDCDGIKVVARKEFDLFLDGTEISFVDTPTAKGFAIDNPNFPAGAGCSGCGGH